MKIEIKSRWEDKVIKVVEAESLRGADLCEADLHGADLRGADLHEARIKKTQVESFVKALYVKMED